MSVSTLHYDPNSFSTGMDWKTRGNIPSFGNRDFYDGLPVTRYFDSARQAGLQHHHFLVDDTHPDLFGVTPTSLLPYRCQKRRRATNAEGKKVKSHHERQYLKKQGRVYDENHQEQKKQELEEEQKQRRQSTPKAVDEDLYKIPPELLYQKSKRRAMLSDYWKRCIGLSCNAV